MNSNKKLRISEVPHKSLFQMQRKMPKISSSNKKKKSYKTNLSMSIITSSKIKTTSINPNFSKLFFVFLKVTFTISITQPPSLKNISSKLSKHIHLFMSIKTSLLRCFLMNQKKAIKKSLTF